MVHGGQILQQIGGHNESRDPDPMKAIESIQVQDLQYYIYFTMP